MMPEISRQPSVYNPFPQLTKVAVAPFINLSTEPTVDGRRFALAYYNELQSVPGFEVVPMGVVERMADIHHISLDSGADARKLAQLLEVDAIVIGAVTDYSPYYPPRCGLQVEWYAANEGFHPIPPGYGLPWGTAEAEQIPGRLIFEAEMALAREQMKTQTPVCNDCTTVAARNASGASRAAHEAAVEKSKEEAVANGATHTIGAAGAIVNTGAELPADWPDPRGFTPPPPSAERPECIPSAKPVLSHTRVFNGNDADFTSALETHVYFRDEARFGGWQSYLERSDDFIRFCCHLHIAEMLTARGGAGESRVVWRWPTGR